MFEENKKPGQSAPSVPSGLNSEPKTESAGPSNLPTEEKEPEDILAGVDNAPKSTPFKPTPPAPASTPSPAPTIEKKPGPPRIDRVETGGVPTPPPMPGEPSKSSGKGPKTFLIIGIIVVVIALIVFGVWYWLNQANQNLEISGNNLIESTEEVIETTVEKETVPEINTTVPVIPETVETEVSLPEEEAPADLDTDGDGLTDKEEAELGTDPDKVDTDDDDLFDREEVKVYKTDPLNPDTDGDGYLDGAEVKAGYNPRGEGELLDINL